MVPRMPFGPTGHDSSRILFGAAALATVDQERADRLLPMLLEFGVNHLDTAASYGDAELRLAPWLRAHPDAFFLATKTAERSGDGARSGLERSLERLGVDNVDLIQLHNLVEPDQWEAAHAPGGALEALLRARDEGLTRFIGVTGHGLRAPAAHRRALQRHDYDSVLFPYNFTLMSDDSYRRDVEGLLDLCTERNVAAVTIKSLARRRWPDTPDYAGVRRHSWYEPLTDDAVIDRAVRFVLADQRVFLASSSDFGLLRTTLEAASSASASVPTIEDLQRDSATYDMAPLFDGGALERI